MKQIKEINKGKLKLRQNRKNETTPQNKMKQKILSSLNRCHKYVNQEYQNCNIIF